jgi:hypothetical protein
MPTRSLISYRVLRANGIHISTVLEKDEETLKLRKGRDPFTTAIAGVDNLYEITIKAIRPAPRIKENVSLTAHEKGPSATICNLA